MLYTVHQQAISYSKERLSLKATSKLHQLVRKVANAFYFPVQ